MILIMMECKKRVAIPLRNKDHDQLRVYIGKKEINTHSFMSQVETMGIFQLKKLICIQLR